MSAQVPTLLSSGDRLVVACLRVTDPQPAVDPLTGGVRREPGAMQAAAAELAAREHALRIGERWCARVLAITVAPPAADDVLREARALGAEVLRIEQCEPADGAAAFVAAAAERRTGGWPQYLADLAVGEQRSARSVAAAIRSVGDATVVLCGDRSSDRGTGAFPAFLAHELRAAQALGVVHLEAKDHHLIAERRLDRGYRERLQVPLPAVCSVEAAGVHLRRASLRAAIRAAGEAVATFTVERDEALASVTLGSPQPRRPRSQPLPPPPGAARERLMALTGALVEHEAATVVGPLGAEQAAAHLLAYLERHGYLAATPRPE